MGSSELRTPEARNGEVNRHCQSERDTHQQIVESESANFRGKEVDH
jgi:hypothetical protein